MKKLTQDDRLIEFYRAAQRIILKRVEKFTMQEICENMKEKCDSMVDSNVIIQAVLDVLDNFLGVGLIRSVIINNNVAGYERVLANNLEQSI